MSDPKQAGWGMEHAKPIVPAGTRPEQAVDTLVEHAGFPPATPQATVRRIQQAAAKGQVALLVTDAAGVVIVGIKGTGGMTGLRYSETDGVWSAEVHLSGVEILDGSYLLRAPLGWGEDEDEKEQAGPLFTCPRCGAESWHPEDARNGYCGRCHDFTAQRRPLPQRPDPAQPTLPLPLGELEGDR